MTTIAFTVPGRPTGKGRPRATTIGGHARMYTPAATLSAEDRVRSAWRDAGATYLGEGAIEIVLTVWESRPASHWTTKGELSAAGRRMPWPTRRPDLDNIVKLIADALNGCAYKDDAQVTHWSAVRKWADRADDRSRMDVTLCEVAL